MYNFEFGPLSSDALHIVDSFFFYLRFDSSLYRSLQTLATLTLIFLFLNHLAKRFIDKYPLIDVEHHTDPLAFHYNPDAEIISDLEDSFLSDHEIDTVDIKGILTPKLSLERFPSLCDSARPSDNLQKFPSLSPSRRTPDIESESRDILTYLDHKTFYKNLNNSSQYLRRDSFSQ